MYLHTQNSAETLIYADIGPNSLQHKSHVTCIFDDDQVEYAQLNQNLFTVKLVPKIETSSIGMSNSNSFIVHVYIYYLCKSIIKLYS